jgi:hypothetical protein
LTNLQKEEVTITESNTTNTDFRQTAASNLMNWVLLVLIFMPQLGLRNSMWWDEYNILGS